jgi:hypothetical protein
VGALRLDGSLFAVLSLLGAVVVLVVLAQHAWSQACPPGALIVNATGTFICAVEAGNYTPIFASLSLAQSGGEFTVTLTCLDSSGCRVNMTIYDYHDNVLDTVDKVTAEIPAGKSETWSYNVTGRGIVEVYVNGALLGYYAAPVVPVPTAVPPALGDLASRDPVLTVAVGLLIVGVPLGWIMQRELGVAGLALAGASMLIYVLTLILTGSPAIATAISAVCGLIGVVLVVMHGGQP